MKKLLITGASGFLGWNICNAARRDHQVYGTYYSHPVNIAGVNMIKADLTNPEKLKSLFNEIRPDVVIHTAAFASPNYCQAHPAESRMINVDTSVNIARLCAKDKIPFAFTSTDLIFDGRNAPYKEEDAARPVNIYGEQKTLAESRILAVYPHTAVCRLPLMFGLAGPSHKTFFQEMVKRIKHGGELKLFEDEYRTPVSAGAAARGILMSLEKVRGIIHLGGTSRISRYNFGLLLADVVGTNKADIIKIRQQDMPMAAPRAEDVSLDSSRAFALGYKPLPLKEELEMLMDNLQ